MKYLGSHCFMRDTEGTSILKRVESESKASLGNEEGDSKLEPKGAKVLKGDEIDEVWKEIEVRVVEGSVSI